MRYWIQSLPSGAVVAIRAVADPSADDDVIPQVWSVQAQRWIDDESILDDMIWDPWVREASVGEIVSIAGQRAA